MCATRTFCILAAAGFLWAPAATGADEPFKTTPVQAQWQYSMDGGKTFSPQAPTITWKRTADEKDAVVATATFEIADPAALGVVRLRVGDVDGAFAVTDAETIDRYNVGAKPNLTKMKLVLNGAAIDSGLAPNTLYRCVPIDAQLLKKGANTLTVSGVYWFQLADPMACPLRLEAVSANTPVLDRLPVLGAIGEDYFTLAARAVVPAAFTITVKPLAGAPGVPIQHTVERAMQMKARVPLPRGVRSFEYSMSVRAGAAEKTYGPYQVRMPTFGEGLRFAVLGNTAVYQGNSQRLKKVLEKILEVHPDLLIHTGKYVDSSPWDFMWTHQFFGVHPETLARIPLFPMCGLREMSSPMSFSRQFYFPPDDSDFARWTTVVGPVRFVAVESWWMSQDKSGEGLKWLDKVLSEAKEPYVVVLNAQVSHCSGPNAGRSVRPIIAYTAKNIDPLLVKYKASIAIGGYHTHYERSEPPAGAGVPTIMTCFAGGSGKPLHQIYVDQNKASRATYRGDHFVLFEVRKDKLVMQTMDIEGKVVDKLELAPRN
ncbi:MAG: hypothetical protein ABFD92_11135 [Planctomycetaceae bacterium]|nr:hypothetical protein [Planctomycetaceae bacterium]